MVQQVINNMTTERIDQELATAQTKFEFWKNLSRLERATTLYAVECLVSSKRDRLSKLLISEISRVFN